MGRTPDPACVLCKVWCTVTWSCISSGALLEDHAEILASPLCLADWLLPLPGQSTWASIFWMSLATTRSPSRWVASCSILTTKRTAMTMTWPCYSLTIQLSIPLPSDASACLPAPISLSLASSAGSLAGVQSRKEVFAVCVLVCWWAPRGLILHALDSVLSIHFSHCLQIDSSVLHKSETNLLEMLCWSKLYRWWGLY